MAWAVQLRTLTTRMSSYSFCRAARVASSLRNASSMFRFCAALMEYTIKTRAPFPFSNCWGTRGNTIRTSSRGPDVLEPFKTGYLVFRILRRGGTLGTCSGRLTFVCRWSLAAAVPSVRCRLDRYVPWPPPRGPEGNNKFVEGDSRIRKSKKFLTSVVSNVSVLCSLIFCLLTICSLR